MRIPSSFWVMTSGFEIASSNPSRRIISMRMASCSSPRPMTLKESARVGGLDADRDVGEQLLLQAVLDVPGGDPAAVSCRRRARCSPRRSSRAWARRCGAAGSGAGVSAEVTVSPMEIPSKPARATISPHSASSASTRFRPSKTKSFVTFVVWRVAVALGNGDGVAELDPPREDAADGRAGRGSRCSRGWRSGAGARRRSSPTEAALLARSASKRGRRSVARPVGLDRATAGRGVRVEHRETRAGPPSASRSMKRS